MVSDRNSYGSEKSHITQLPCAWIASREHSLRPETENSIKLWVFLPGIWAGILYLSLPRHTDRLLESAPAYWCLYSETNLLLCLNLKEVPVHSKLCSPGALTSRLYELWCTGMLYSFPALQSCAAKSEHPLMGRHRNWSDLAPVMDPPAFPHWVTHAVRAGEQNALEKNSLHRQGRAKRAALYLSWPLICSHRICKV